MPEDYKIKFYCRSFNKDLYERSRHLYESAGYPCVRLTDKTADGYFYDMLEDTGCDIAVNVDEDCFITDLEVVESLVAEVVAGGYANCGCGDGGGGCARVANPLVTNPFFNILNLRLIRTAGTAADIRKAAEAFSYPEHKEEMKAAFPKELLSGQYNFERWDFEPYYPFFLWLAFTFKTLYLRSEKHLDGTTTIAYSPSGAPFCLHTWFARFYDTPAWLIRIAQQKKSVAHKQRIDARIAEAYNSTGEKPLPRTAAQRLSYATDKTMRWLIKIPQRIAGWPKKIKRKING